MQHFQSHKPDDIVLHKDCGYFTSSQMEKRKPGCMNQEEFNGAITKVLGTDEYQDYIEKLFTKLDTSCDGYVDWNEFCTYLLLLYRENDYIRTKKEIPFTQEPKIRHVVPNRQEPTTKILVTDGPCRFITVSKEGTFSVWTPSMQLDRSYDITANDKVESSGTRRRFKKWVTDAIYMKNCNKIVVGTSSRELRFYDISTSHFFEEFHLFGMSDVPYCFDYWYDKTNLNSESLLVCGLDSGTLVLFYFKKPVTQLFETPFKNEPGALKVFIQDLKSQHSKWVRYTCLSGIHSEMIRQVKYLPENGSIISSSSCPDSSLLISDINRFKHTYVFKSPKGVECFDYNKSMNILVSGSADHNIQLWNPYMTSKPIAVLQGHNTGVIAVALHKALLQIFSLSRDAVIKVWDLKEHTCLQTIAMKFPSSIHGRVPEHGQFPMCLLTTANHSCLLVTCNDYIGQLSLGNTTKNPRTTPITHDSQLCCALYNQFFKQVVTGCDSSTISVWDIEAGSKAIVFSNAHGNEEITCMKFDTTWRRLLTGARNGTIKVWNFQNGHNLHKLEPVADADVTGLLALNDRKVILAVGWSRLITMYDDSDPDNMYVTSDLSWRGGQLHKDDISAMDHCPPNLLATASFDGIVYIWKLETEQLLLKITHQNEGNKMQPVPVDVVMFLKYRALKSREAATLISSVSGTFHWWNISAEPLEYGRCFMAEQPGDSVIGMCTSHDDQTLVTSDSSGFIKVFNIHNYCTTQTPQVVTEPPQLLHCWKGHEGTVVSVEYINHDAGTFILSASVDKTAKLWTISGDYVGTFGQKHQWDLKSPKTWGSQHTSPSKDETKQHIGTVNDISQEILQTSSQNELDIQLSSSSTLPDLKELKSTELKDQQQTNNTEVDPTKQSPVPTKSLQQECNPNSKDITKTNEWKDTVQAMEGKDKNQNLRPFLGAKVLCDLQRKRQDRHERRQQYGEIDTKQMARFGKICTPFQALSMPAATEESVLMEESSRILSKFENDVMTV
ncbi:WD repeat-containing protein on Y chromosome-like [Argonauta hians]